MCTDVLVRKNILHFFTKRVHKSSIAFWIKIWKSAWVLKNNKISRHYYLNIIQMAPENTLREKF